MAKVVQVKDLKFEDKVTVNNEIPATVYNIEFFDHHHQMEDIDGLDEALRQKTSVGHSHYLSDIVDLDDLNLDQPGQNGGNQIPGIGDIVGGNTSETVITAHSHEISDINSLQSTLDGKAASVHQHELSDVNDLQSSLSSKTDIGHLHQLSDISTLQNSLNSKADDVHIHELSDINSLTSLLSEKASLIHEHQLSDINSLQQSLNSKSNDGHSHQLSDIANLESSLSALSSQIQIDSPSSQATILNERLSTVESTTQSLGTLANYNIAVLTYAQYMALEDKDPTTLYFVTNAS